MALKCIEYIRTYIQVCVILTSINTKDYNTHTHTKKKLVQETKGDKNK